MLFEELEIDFLNEQTFSFLDININTYNPF